MCTKEERFAPATSADADLPAVIDDLGRLAAVAGATEALTIRRDGGPPMRADWARPRPHLVSADAIDNAITRTRGFAWFQNNVRVDAIHRLFRLSTNRRQHDEPQRMQM